MIAGDMVSEFVDAAVIEAMDTMLSTNDVKKVQESAMIVASAFLGGGKLAGYDDDPEACERKLLASFQKNTVLLVQKTWVEKDDFSLKEQVLYKLEQFATKNDTDWRTLYPTFRGIIIDVVYLMFGSQSRSKDFAEWALRIDPEFGIFWWYFEKLPETMDWSSDKCYYVLLVGMVFLANY